MLHPLYSSQKRSQSQSLISVQCFFPLFTTQTTSILFLWGFPWFVQKNNKISVNFSDVRRDFWDFQEKPCFLSNHSTIFSQNFMNVIEKLHFSKISSILFQMFREKVYKKFMEKLASNFLALSNNKIFSPPKNGPLTSCFTSNEYSI